MTYAQAQAELKRVGSGKAEGSALRALYTEELARRWSIRAESLFDWMEAQELDMRLRGTYMATHDGWIWASFLPRLPMDTKT